MKNWGTNMGAVDTVRLGDKMTEQYYRKQRAHLVRQRHKLVRKAGRHRQGSFWRKRALKSLRRVNAKIADLHRRLLRDVT